MPHFLELNKKCSHSDKNCLICIKEECNCLGPSCYECAFFNHKGHFDSCIPIDFLKFEHNPKDLKKNVEEYKNKLINFQNEINCFIKDKIYLIEQFKDFKASNFDDIADLSLFNKFKKIDEKNYFLDSKTIDKGINEKILSIFKDIKKIFIKKYEKFIESLNDINNNENIQKSDLLSKISKENNNNNNNQNIKDFNFYENKEIIQFSSFPCNVDKSEIIFSLKKTGKIIKIILLKKKGDLFNPFFDKNINGYIENIIDHEKCYFNILNNTKEYNNFFEIKMIKDFIIYKNEKYKIVLNNTSNYYCLKNNMKINNEDFVFYTKDSNKNLFNVEEDIYSETNVLINNFIINITLDIDEKKIFNPFYSNNSIFSNKNNNNNNIQNNNYLLSNNNNNNDNNNNNNNNINFNNSNNSMENNVDDDNILYDNYIEEDFDEYY